MSSASMEHIFQKMVRAGEAVNKKGYQVEKILTETDNDTSDVKTEIVLTANLSSLEKTMAHLKIAMESFVEETEKYTNADKAERDEASRRTAEAIRIMSVGEELQIAGGERIEIWKAMRTSLPTQQKEKTESDNNLEEEKPNKKNPATLPKIEIPHFDGDISQFKNFWAMFENSFHNNTEISNMTKFTYLHYYLKGSAAKLIRRYDVNEDNYEAAVALLKKRYDNQKLVINEMNEELRNLRALSDQTTDQQDMFDRIFILVDQLHRRGEPMDGSLIRSMIIEKFSERIQERILKKSAKDAMKGEEWTITELLAEVGTILERERDLTRAKKSLREGLQPGGKHMTNSQMGRRHPSDGSNSRNSTHTTKSKQNRFTPVCKLCENEGHHVFNCDKYSTPQTRRALLKTKKGTCWNCLANNHDTRECQSLMNCKHCNGRHHSALCLSDRKETQQTKSQTDKKEKTNEKEWLIQRNGAKSTSNNNFSKQTQEKIEEENMGDSNLKEIEMPPPGKLITLRTKAYNQKLGEWQNVSVFLDNGSSNSYVTRSLAENWELEKIGFTRFGMQTFSNDIEQKSMDVAKISLQEASGAVRSLKVMVTEKMTGKLSKAKLTDQDLQYIAKMEYTVNSEAFDNHSEPDITIGMDYYSDIQIGTVNLPSGIKLINTIYGFTTMGKPSEIQEPEHEAISFNNSIVPEENDFQMEFEMLGEEEFTGSLKDEKRIEDEKVHENFKRTIEKRGDRYFVRLPTKPGARESLPDNYGIALRRLESISKQFNPDVLQEIDKIFNKQEEDGIIERVQSGDDSEKWIHYNPHQPVVTPQKTTTKVRVVIDGSSHLKNKPSLNDMLYQGPVILPEISHLFLRFRSGDTAIISDVEKAFLQVFIHEEDRDATRVLWLKDFTKPATKNNIVIFRFNRVIFGLNCSPFLLAGTILYHLEQTNNALTHEIKNNMYVDNLAMTTDKTRIAELQPIYKNSKKVFQEMGMNLREFLTNNGELMQSIPEVDRAATHEMKFLGIQWDAKEDKLKLKCEVKSTEKWTKRAVSSVIGAIYDPQGYFAPLLLPLKRFLASAWDQEIGWDETIPNEWVNEWDTMIQKINGYSKEIPRRIFTKSETNTIVTFSDASQYAYAACSYAVNSYGSNLAFAKTRLKPSKVKWTIPKLELAGICLGMEITKTVLVAMKTGGIKVDKAYLLTDSEIVIGWLKAQPGKKETGVYISNRLISIRTMVTELEQTGTSIEFGYINTKINPADVASRGGSQEELSELWWHGPDFIKEGNYKEWPQSTKLFKLTDVTGETLEISHMNFVQQYEKDPDNTVFDCRRTNSYSKMIRIAAYVNRFIRRSMRTLTESSKSRIYNKLPELNMEEPMTKTPNFLEWKNAEKSLIRDQQKILQVKQLKKLQNLNVKLDKDGLLRCHGRMENAELATNQKQPFLISEKSAFATLLVRHHHEHWHGSTSQTVGFVRRKFWIPKLRQLVKKIRARCTPCQKIHKAAYKYPDMANLPGTRVRKSRPFQHCGVDYFGPIFVRQKDGSKGKVFGCIITCLSTRLTFLDVAQDLSTTSFLNVLRRFFSLRGVPDTMVSDNGPHFILADEMIQQAGKKIEEVKEECEIFAAERGIEWKFNTAFSPWKGGVFERLIRITKEALHKSIGKRVITEEDLRTNLYEIADSMNKRPLTYAEDDVDEIRPIRPIDFLQKNFEIYDPIAAIAIQGKDQEDEYQSPEDLVKLKTMRDIRRSLKSSYTMTEKFWKIFTEKYLNQLRETHKLRMDNKKGTNETPTLGKVVLICDERYPRNVWKMGRITKIIRNSNQVVREIEVTYMTNPENDGWRKRTIRRPPNLVVPLELEDEEEHQEQMEIAQDPVISETPENVERRYNLRKRKEVNYVRDGNVANVNFSHTLGGRKPITWWTLFYLITLLLPITKAITENQTAICTDNGLRLNVTGISKLEICAKDYCVQRESMADENYMEILMPTKIKLSSHKITIKRLRADGIQLTDLQCPAVNICNAVNCFWCTATITNPECNPKLAIAMVFFTLYIIFAICFIIARVKVPIGGPCFLAIQMGWQTMVILRHVLRLGWIILKTTFSTIRNWLMGKWRKLRKERNEEPRHKHRRFYEMVTVLFIATIFTSNLKLANACQEIEMSTSKDKTCIIKDNGSMKCRIKTSEILTLNAGKQEVCLRISRNGTYTKEIRIQWINIELKCEKQIVTFTRNTIQKVLSAKRCPHAGSCTGTKCDGITRSSKIEEFKEVNDHLGFTGCRASCGDMACGCFFPSTGCLFYRIYAEPTSSSIYEIFRCEVWKEFLNVNITVTEISSKNAQQTSLATKLKINENILVDKNGISLKMIHIPNSPILNTWFLRKGKSIAMWKENEFPIVRCDSEENAKSMNCSFEENCKCDPSEETMHCTCKDQKIEEKLIDLSYALPITTPVWQIRGSNNGKASAVSEQATAAEIAISIDELEDITIIKTIDECSIENSQAEGCYSCEEGSRTEVKCTSKRKEVIGDVNCGTEKFAVKCTPTGSTTTLRFFIDTAKFDRTCTVNCGRGSNNFSINSILKFHGSIWDESWKVLTGKTKLYGKIQLPDFHHLLEVYKSFMLSMFITVTIIAGIGLILAFLIYTYGIQTTSLIFKMILHGLFNIAMIPVRICRRLRPRRRATGNIPLIALIILFLHSFFPGGVLRISTHT